MHVYRWDTDNSGNTVGKVPRDRWNDAVKAVVYGLVDRFGYVNRTADQSVVEIQFFGKTKRQTVGVK